jgi:microcystin-dependent protein
MMKVSARLFPIGYIISVDAPNFNPNDFYLDGNWERIKGRVIVGVDEAQTEFNATGKTGGSKTHTLTINELPQHRHRFANYNASGSGTYNIPTSFTYNQGGRGYEGNITAVGGVSTNGVDYPTVGQPHNNLSPYQTAYVWKLISYSN